MNIQNAVLEAQQAGGLFPAGSTVIAGVSGGADSLALLHALAALRKRLGVQIVAATLDHGLRGDAGAEDAAHAVKLAERWGLTAVLGKVDVRREAARTKRGIEETARDLRYQFLGRVAADHGTNFVAVAHHAGDQAETMLLHLFRGSGLDGLAGMQPRTELTEYGIVLLRPLLAVSRAGIEAYCHAHSITAREDASNADTGAARNWLRHVVLPLIETRFPGAPRALGDLAASAALDTGLLADLTEGLARQARTEPGVVTLPRSVYRAAPPALQRRFIRWAAHSLAPDAELSHERTEAVVRLFELGHKGQRVELPGGLSATVDGEDVRLMSPGRSV